MVTGEVWSGDQCGCVGIFNPDSVLLLLATGPAGNSIQSQLELGCVLLRLTSSPGLLHAQSQARICWSGDACETSVGHRREDTGLNIIRGEKEYTLSTDIWGNMQDSKA